MRSHTTELVMRNVLLLLDKNISSSPQPCYVLYTVCCTICVLGSNTHATLRWILPKARFPFKRKRLRWHAANHGCHCFDRAFLLAGGCVSCGFRLRNERNTSDCVWMETGLKVGFHYPSSRAEFTGRVDGPRTRVHFLTPVNSGRELG